MNNLLFIFIGIIIGMVAVFIFIYYQSSSMMIWENRSRYGFDQTVEKLTRSVEEAQWKMPAVHDLQETMKKNGYDVRRVKVFEICQPAIAQQILSKDAERLVSSLMPCRIAVYEKSDGQVYISRINSGLIGKLMKGVIPKVMKEATDGVENILNEIVIN